MEAIEIVTARGHPQIKALHPTTLMITKDKEVGLKGDCIIAVAADKGVADLSETIKQMIRSGCRILITLEVNDAVETVQAFGHPDLTLAHTCDMVVRKSAFKCDRTLAIRANKAAADLSRTLVARLKDPTARVKISVKTIL
ncbi:MAG: DUF371 domain-containing protein [Hadesarchaea archaeon]|nr:DUF371 domain-containing protein [Hadesarchaea archaeon]